MTTLNLDNFKLFANHLFVSSEETLKNLDFSQLAQNNSLELHNFELDTFHDSLDILVPYIENGETKLSFTDNVAVALEDKKLLVVSNIDKVSTNTMQAFIELIETMTREKSTSHIVFLVNEDNIDYVSTALTNRLICFKI